MDIGGGGGGGGPDDFGGGGGGGGGGPDACVGIGGGTGAEGTGAEGTGAEGTEAEGTEAEGTEAGRCGEVEAGGFMAVAEVFLAFSWAVATGMVVTTDLELTCSGP